MRRFIARLGNCLDVEDEVGAASVWLACMRLLVGCHGQVGGAVSLVGVLSAIAKRDRMISYSQGPPNDNRDGTGGDLLRRCCIHV
jgi:hypothetical protein